MEPEVDANARDLPADPIDLLRELLQTDPVAGIAVIFILSIFTLFILFPLTLRAIRDFIEFSPAIRKRSTLFAVLDVFFGFLTRGAIGSDLEEKVSENQILKTEVARLRAEIETQSKRSPVDLLPTAVTTANSWQSPVIASRNRLLSEIERLRTRSTAYLVFGVFLSLAAVALFFFIIFYLEDLPEDASALSYLKDFLPKFTLAVMVQIIASFFLRMHVSSEREIKWTSNELTNLEHRFAAMALSEAGMSEELVSKLARTERNFLIEKDQKAIQGFDGVSVETLQGVLQKLTGQTD